MNEPLSSLEGFRELGTFKEIEKQASLKTLDDGIMLVRTRFNKHPDAMAKSHLGPL